MKSTKQDMERLIALHPYTNPASVPVEYTLGDRHYCGFPAEFHPVAETRRVDANLYETTVTAHTPEGLELRAVCQSFLDFPVVDWVMYVTNRGSDNSPVLSDWHITTTYSGQSPVLAHSNGDTCGEDGYTWFDTVPEDGGAAKKGRFHITSVLHRPSGGNGRVQGRIGICVAAGQAHGGWTCFAPEMPLRSGQDRRHLPPTSSRVRPSAPRV